MAEIFITYKKNCFLPDEISGDSEEISVNDFNAVMDFLIANKEKSCVLSGNEPMLHSRLKELFSIARQKRVFTVIETGLTYSEGLSELLLNFHPEIKWKIYHPSLYPLDNWDKFSGASLKIIKDSKINAGLSVIIHESSLDYGFFTPLLEEFNFDNINIEVLPKALDVPEKGRVGELILNTVEAIKKKAGRETKITLGCIAAPCIFSNETYGFLSKSGVVLKKCLPLPGILPELKIYHCRALLLLNDKLKDLSSFNNLSQAMEYFFGVYGELQRSFPLFEECAHCLSHDSGLCLKGCLALKKSKKPYAKKA